MSYLQYQRHYKVEINELCHTFLNFLEEFHHLRRYLINKHEIFLEILKLSSEFKKFKPIDPLLFPLET